MNQITGYVSLMSDAEHARIRDVIHDFDMEKVRANQYQGDITYFAMKKLGHDQMFICDADIHIRKQLCSVVVYSEDAIDIETVLNALLNHMEDVISS